MSAVDLPNNKGNGEIEYKLYSTLPEEARLIRTEVFMEEQGFKNEFDDDDSRCIHAVIFSEGKPAATGRLFPPENGVCAIGRLAVRKSFRGKNLGAETVMLLEEKARELGAEKIALSAQCRVREFYEKLGYTASGEVYSDEFCPHIHMEKLL
ncbi:MAG: GNAT family N-acetyltransferase [Oscillospiraceae bacterium]|nr:GNAT family N-acetyltransferase [Oscillospiraceae bacterium]